MCLEWMDARKVERRGCGEGRRAGLSAGAAHKVPPDEKAKPRVSPYLPCLSRGSCQPALSTLVHFSLPPQNPAKWASGQEVGGSCP